MLCFCDTIKGVCTKCVSIYIPLFIILLLAGLMYISYSLLRKYRQTKERYEALSAVLNTRTEELKKITEVLRSVKTEASNAYDRGYRQGFEEGRRSVNAELAAQLVDQQYKRLREEYNKAKKALTERNKEIDRMKQQLKHCKQELQNIRSVCKSKFVEQVVNAPLKLLLAALVQRQDKRRIADFLLEKVGQRWY